MVAPRRLRARKPQKVTPRLIHAMVRRLVRQFDPEQIILFGSLARGIPVANDVIVVTPDDLDRFRNIPGTLTRLALLEGKVLYVRV